MTRELAPVPASIPPPAPRVELLPEQIAEFVEKPLRQLPDAWRPVVWDFWAKWSFLIKDQLALCARLRDWRDDGLTLDDLRGVINRFRDPDRMARLRWAGDLMAEFATEVGEAIRRHRVLAEQQARRDEQADAAARAVPTAELKRVLEQWRNPSCG